MIKLLTNDIKLRILQIFIPLCDESRKLENNMGEKGISSFKIIQEFEESFCPSGVSHYKFMQEQAKEIISSYNGSIAMSAGDLGIGYKSPYLSTLIEQRDKNNGMEISELQFKNPPLWTLEADPCRRERIKMWLESTSEFEIKKKESDSLLKNSKQSELHRVLSVDAISTSLEKYDRSKYLKHFMTKYLGDIGFLFSNKSSSILYPVFKKELTSSVDICCGIRNAKSLNVELFSGVIELVFHLRIKRFNTAKIEVSPFFDDKDNDKFVIIRSQNMIPYFLDAYIYFNSIEELELNIFSQVMLFEVVFKQLEENLKYELEELGLG